MFELYGLKTKMGDQRTADQLQREGMSILKAKYMSMLPEDPYEDEAERARYEVEDVAHEMGRYLHALTEQEIDPRTSIECAKKAIQNNDLASSLPFAHSVAKRRCEPTSVVGQPLPSRLKWLLNGLPTLHRIVSLRLPPGNEISKSHVSEMR